MAVVTTSPERSEAAGRQGASRRAALTHAAPFLGMLLLAAPQGLFGGATARRV